MTASLWVALVSAVVGAAAGLTGALLTQLLTRRRDDTRWARERAERREQWLREDAARWLANRRAAYTDLLAALHEHWSAVAALHGRPPQREELADLQQLAQVADRARHAVSLLAPAGVARPADTLTDLVCRAGERSAGLHTGPTPDPAAVSDGFAALRAAMRADLGTGTPA